MAKANGEDRPVLRTLEFAIAFVPSVPSVFWALAPLAFLSGCTPDGVSFPADGGAWPARPLLAFARQPRLVTADISDDTLGFVSLDPTPRLLGLPTVGDNPVEIEGPHDVSHSPDGAFLYVVLSNYAPGTGTGPHGAHGLGTVPGSLLKLAARDLGKVAGATLDRNTSEIIITDDGKTAYVSHFDLLRLMNQLATGLPDSDGLSTVAVVDTATMARPLLYPVCPTTHDLELSKDEKTLYITCSMTDEIALFDTTSHEVTRVAVGLAPGKPLMPQYFPYALLRAPADDSLWISCNTSAELRVFDTHAGKMDYTRTVSLMGVPMFGAFLSDGKTMLVAEQGIESIAIVDTSTSRVMHRIAIPGMPADLCYHVRNIEVSDDDKTAWATCEGDQLSQPGSVLTIDISDLRAPTVTGWVHVGLFPNAMTLLPPAP